VTPALKVLLLRILTKATEDSRVIDLLSTIVNPIPTLVGLLSEVTMDVRIEATKVLGRLAKLDSMKTGIRTSGGIRQMVEALGGSSDETLLEHTAQTLHSLVFNNDENRSAVGEIAVPALLILLTSHYIRILEAVTATLSGTSFAALELF
jgi:hypothetical protein